MGYWSELVDELSDIEDLPSERLADLWILLGSQTANSALVALADMDVVVRAMRHLALPVDERLSHASLRFLRNLAAHSSEQDVEGWFDAVQRQLGTTKGKASDARAMLSQMHAVLSDASTERKWIVAPMGSGKTHLLVRLVAEHLAPEEMLTAAAELAALHPDLVGEQGTRIRSVLATVAARDRLIEQLAGNPRRVLHAEGVADSLLRQARIAGEAMASIWEYPMLEARAAAVALGAKPGNREKVRTYRDRSWLLGLPKGRGFMYPRFQFDPESHDVYSTVRSVNEFLRSADDPWGVASWWIMSNERIGCRPVELVETARAPEVIRAAQALLEPVG